MKKLVLNAIAAVLMVLGLGTVASLSPAYAAQGLCPNGDKIPAGGSLADCNDDFGQNAANNEDNLMATLTVIVNVIVGVVGFVAVVMIVIGGISFATSQGDTGRVAKARNTILYGVVGLVVALLAYAIVNFVISSIFKAA